MKRFFSMVIFSLAATGVFAQKKADTTHRVVPVNLVLKAKGFSDHITLRWGIDQSAAWAFLQRGGVWIERISLDKANKPQEKKWKRLNEIPVLPWSPEKFKAAIGADTGDVNLMVAAQGLYGEASLGKKDMKGMQSLQDAYMEYQNRFTLAFLSADFSSKAAQALGLRWEDKFIPDTNFKYVYRIYPALTDKAYKTDTAYYIYSAFAKNEHRKPEMLKAVSKDKLVELHWPKDGIYNTFTAYNVERSADGKNFKKINDRPVVYSLDDTISRDYVYSDSIKNSHTYFYRINGIDAFADPSNYSRVVKGQSLQQIPLAPPAILKGLLDGKKQVNLKWSLPAGIPDKIIAGFIIQRGAKRNAVSEVRTGKLLPATTRNYVDNIEKPEQGMFYEVLTVDTAGHYTPSVPVYVFAYDVTPPTPPTGLTGAVDTLGHVRLKWNQDKTDNIIGYKVFRANKENHTFIPITSSAIDDTTFVDTLSLHSLDHKVFYQVVAVDGNNNHSKYSQTFALSRPHVLPPVAPVIGAYKVTKKAVSFEWALSSSDDVLQYRILRKGGKDSLYKTIVTVAANVTKYADTTIMPGTIYQYTIQAVDDHQLSSKQSYPLSVKVYQSGAKGKIVHVLLKQDKNANNISWKTEGETPAFFIVYKDNGNGLIQYKSAGAQLLNLQDAQRSAGKVRYAVKGVYDDQTETELTASEWLTAN